MCVWLWRKVCDLVTGCGLSSVAEENDLSEEVQIRAPVTVASEGLDSRYGTLDRAGCVRQGQAVGHGVEVAFDAVGERAELRDVVGVDGGGPFPAGS
jgi:hypothetical protein